MSRRDTIIIAVLVNAGLLFVLFATAFRGEKKEPNPAGMLAEAVKTAPEIAQRENILSKDVEQVLNQLVSAPNFGVPSEEITLNEEIAIPLPPAENAFILPPANAQPAQLATPLKPPLKVSKEENFLTVTVKKGDVLEKIARTHQSSITAIMNANHLASTQLKVGQVLKVPVKEGTKAVVSSPQESPISTVADYYVVKEGDSPWLIATKNHVKVEDLLKLNGLDEQKARRLRPGDRLRIR